MKRGFVLLAFIALLAPPALHADGLTLNAGLTAWGVDAGAVNDSSIYPAIIPAFNLGYSAAISGYALKFGLAAEDALINYSGLTWGSSSAKSAQTAEFLSTGRGEPYAEIAAGNLSIHVGMPLYYFTPNSPSADQNGYKNALKWMYKGVGLQYYTATSTSNPNNYGTDFNANNNFLLTNYDAISYKLTISDTISIVPSLLCDFIFVPAVAVADLKPAVAFNYGPVSLNAQVSYYPIAEGIGIKVPMPNNTSVYNTYVLTIDPKLSLSFDKLGIKGLTAFMSSSIPVKTELYDNKGLNLIPGLAYKGGALSLEADMRINYLDYASGDGTNYKQTELDPFVKVSYSLKL